MWLTNIHTNQKYFIKFYIFNKLRAKSYYKMEYKYLVDTNMGCGDDFLLFLTKRFEFEFIRIRFLYENIVVAQCMNFK